MSRDTASRQVVTVSAASQRVWRRTSSGSSRVMWNHLLITDNRVFDKLNRLEWKEIESVPLD